MRVHFVHADVDDAVEHRQADGANAGVKFRHARERRDLAAHVVDDVLGDLEIALPECPGRIVHRRPAEMLHHARRPAPVLKFGSENGIGVPGVGVEPETVQVAAEPLADQREALRQRRRCGGIGDEHHLRGLRCALDHHL